MKKTILWIALLLPFSISNLLAQEAPTVQITEKITPDNWHLLDREKTGFYGISLDRAYSLLKGKKSQQVIVAVIDSGIDTLHEDLKPVLWKNTKEIPGNGKDDDKNGYTDDYYGWNFLGGKDGKNVKQDSDEASRVYWKLKNKFGNTIPDTSALKGEEKMLAAEYIRAKNEVVDDVNPFEVMSEKRILNILLGGDSIITRKLNKKVFDGNDLKDYVAEGQEDWVAVQLYKELQKQNNDEKITNTDVINYFQGKVRKAQNADTPPKDYRGEIVGDNYDDINDRYYGNSDVMAGTPSHGTHCSGIIGAARNNDLGIDGVADNVKIMMLRAVPDGDEHDKDIALAIRYAVDNGAKIISMSFGKSYSPQKNWVDDAVKYAAAHDVLLVHAAGNDSRNLDSSFNFPNPVFQDGSGEARNFITVGASGDPTNGGFTASFSNYGKNSVDVFAPGVNIYSTLPGGNVYGKMSGTSMAAPVVSGIAALLLEYFPTLSAEQLKYVIEKSVVPITEDVILPGTQDADPVKVKLSDISKTGGEVNAYNAVKLAQTLKGERKAR
ncbi:MAG: S8 family serine peptidase [Chitinophagaceae bacterium]|nr:S8 family serine peptidase [Chitinophagaceae bacterium]MCZ2397274.1 S8 family peptidase [Chitinophagales bacterium]